MANRSINAVHVWLCNATGDLTLAKPWFEPSSIIACGDSIEDSMSHYEGTFVQIGWLVLSNDEHGFWLGGALHIKSGFEDLGPLDDER